MSSAGENEDKRVSYAEVLGRYHHKRHDRIWSKQYHVIIVLVAGDSRDFHGAAGGNRKNCAIVAGLTQPFRLRT